MNSGVIGKIHGEFSDLESEIWTITDRDYELKRAVDVRDTYELSDSKTAYSGKVATEILKKESNAEISSQGISETAELDPVTKSSEFLAISDDFLLVENSQGTFGYDLIGKLTTAHIERARIQLEPFTDDKEIGEIWQLGFYGTGGRAEKGVVYGNQVLDDSEFGSVLDLSNKNQIGIDFPYQDKAIKMTASESGYVEVYQPSDYKTEDFVNFFLNEIAPYVVDSEF
ncbi:hypothetical protein [Natronococcus pandeyae]|uniref:hypothetical protein n=1 Tax=Natronococcus pandeyae TaxID=2055836 RepID=UPI0011E77046|nr:hypothetical protein [Natronococcus pandeyae]